MKKATGRIEVLVLEDDIPISHQRFHNLVTDDGWELLAQLVHGEGDPVTHLALGTGSRAPAAGDTALQQERYRDIATNLTATGNELRVSHFLPTTAANGHTLREIGLLNAATRGTLFARALLSQPITKTNRITASITWNIELDG